MCAVRLRASRKPSPSGPNLPPAIDPLLARQVSQPDGRSPVCPLGGFRLANRIMLDLLRLVFNQLTQFKVNQVKSKLAECGEKKQL